MKRTVAGLLVWVAGWLLMGGGVGELRAQAVRTQTLPLRAGWNAVFLQVQPLETRPAELLRGLPVDVVARYFPVDTPVRFISDPGQTDWKRAGWGVWYGPERAEAVVSDLHAIHGNQAYLIHATADAVWSVSGLVRAGRVRWRVDSFNLVGFCLDEVSPPAFGLFFGGARGLLGRPVYRLVEGRWELVSAPDSVRMRDGEAYWVFCRGETAYEGPLEVRFSGVDELDFGGVQTELGLGLVNRLGSPATVWLTQVVLGGDLPLARVVEQMGTLRESHLELSGRVESEQVESGAMQPVRLRVRRALMERGEQTALLKVATDQGVVCWVSARARRPDLAGQP